EIRAARRPVVLRGLVGAWPVVRADDVVAYLTGCGPTRPISAIAAPPQEQGRFFYDRALSGLNFGTARMTLPEFLAQLRAAAAQENPPGLAVQSEIISELLPRFADENALELLPQVKARIWIGNRIRVAPHFDLMENVACNVAGRRRFTLFPPDQI